MWTVVTMYWPVYMHDCVDGFMCRCVIVESLRWCLISMSGCVDDCVDRTVYVVICCYWYADMLMYWCHGVYDCVDALRCSRDQLMSWRPCCCVDAGVCWDASRERSEREEKFEIFSELDGNPVFAQKFPDFSHPGVSNWLLFSSQPERSWTTPPLNSHLFRSFRVCVPTFKPPKPTFVLGGVEGQKALDDHQKLHHNYSKIRMVQKNVIFVEICQERNFSYFSRKLKLVQLSFHSSDSLKHIWWRTYDFPSFFGFAVRGVANHSAMFAT